MNEKQTEFIPCLNLKNNHQSAFITGSNIKYPNKHVKDIFVMW